MDALKVLAVGDPAVYVYTDPKYGIISRFVREKQFQVDFHIVPFTDYYPSMMKSLAETHEYDIVMVAGHLWLKDLVKNGYLARVQYHSHYHKETIMQPVLEEMKIDGQPYLYPSFCDGHIFVYRKSIVEPVLGFKLGKVIDTDMIIFLSKIVDGIDGMQAIALKAHPSEIFLDFLPYLRNEGVEAFDSQTYEPTFNNEAGRKALEKYISLRQYAPEDTVHYGNDEVREAFQKKKVAMTVTWGGQLGFLMDERCLDPDDVGFAVIKTAWNVTWSFAIDRHSPRKEIANEFLTYLNSPKVDRIVGGYAGSAITKTAYLLDSARYPWYEVHRLLLETYAKPLPMMERASDKLAPLYHHVHQALIGKESVTEALERAEKEIREII